MLTFIFVLAFIMQRLLILLCSTLLLSACSSTDKAYYLTHPKAREQAIRACEVGRAQAVSSCDEQRALATVLNQLAYELQSNQQQYGQAILLLQQQRAQATDATAQKALDEQIQLRLAVVNWLASPGGSGW